MANGNFEIVQSFVRTNRDLIEFAYLEGAVDTLVDSLGEGLHIDSHILLLLEINTFKYINTC